MPKENKMNKRRFLVSIVVLVLLSVAVFATTRVAALRPSGTVGNQVFYSASIESIIPPTRTEPIANQVFYSPSVASLVGLNHASKVSNQMFYSAYVENFNPDLTSDFSNQVFYSPTIEGFIH
jgi:hypothetical protein